MNKNNPNPTAMPTLITMKPPGLWKKTLNVLNRSNPLSKQKTLQWASSVDRMELGV